MNPVFNFVKIARRDGWLKAWKKLQYQYIMLETPEQQLKKEVFGYCGMLLGVTLAGVVFAWRRQYHLVPLFAFIFYINLTQAKGKYRQLLTLKDIKEKFEGGGL